VKVLLINPPFGEEYAVGESRSIKAVLNVIPPLGLGYLAAVLQKEGIETKIIDCTVGPSQDDLIKVVTEEKPDIAGISATTPSFESAKVISRNIKRISPKTVIVLGGAHVSAIPEEALLEESFDLGVLGEGEVTFLEIVKTYSKDKDTRAFRKIKGIAFREDDRVIKTEPREFIENLDELPFPARNLMPPLRKYHPTPASYRRLPLGVVMTSRGCPMHCTFCDRAVFGNTHRSRSPQNVMDEIEELIKKYGAREIRFFDDTFTLKKDFVFGLCDEMERRRLKFPWTCLTTVLAVTRQMLKRMREVGCWQVLFGLESGDDGMLKLLKKGNTVETNRRAVRWAQEAGLEVRADFIVGTPGETIKSLNNTLNFALEMNLDYAHFNHFIPFPGTEIYRGLSNQGYVFDFSKGCSILDHGALLYVPEAFTPQQFRDWLDSAFEKFYLRPRYIIRRLLSLRSFAQLKGQLKGFFAVYNLR